MSHRAEESRSDLAHPNTPYFGLSGAGSQPHNGRGNARRRSRKLRPVRPGQGRVRLSRRVTQSPRSISGAVQGRCGQQWPPRKWVRSGGEIGAMAPERPFAWLPPGSGGWGLFIATVLARQITREVAGFIQVTDLSLPVKVFSFILCGFFRFSGVPFCRESPEFPAAPGCALRRCPVRDCGGHPPRLAAAGTHALPPLTQPWLSNAAHCSEAMSVPDFPVPPDFARIIRTFGHPLQLGRGFWARVP